MSTCSGPGLNRSAEYGEYLKWGLLVPDVVGALRGNGKKKCLAQAQELLLEMIQGAAPLAGCDVREWGTSRWAWDRARDAQDVAFMLGDVGVTWEGILHFLFDTSWALARAEVGGQVDPIFAERMQRFFTTLSRKYASMCQAHASYSTMED